MSAAKFARWLSAETATIDVVPTWVTETRGAEPNLSRTASRTGWLWMTWVWVSTNDGSNDRCPDPNSDWSRSSCSRAVARYTGVWRKERSNAEITTIDVRKKMVHLRRRSTSRYSRRSIPP
jgi:hypothetical protein